LSILPSIHTLQGSISHYTNWWERSRSTRSLKLLAPGSALFPDRRWGPGRSFHILEGLKFKIGHVMWPHSFQGRFVRCWLRLVMFNNILNLKCLRWPATKKWKATPNEKKIKKSRFEPPFGGLKANAQGSSMVDEKRVVDFLLAIIAILASSHVYGTIKWNLSKSAFSNGGGSVWAQTIGRCERHPQSIYGPLDRETM